MRAPYKKNGGIFLFILFLEVGARRAPYLLVCNILNET